jgi:hypothetical protein
MFGFGVFVFADDFIVVFVIDSPLSLRCLLPQEPSEGVKDYYRGGHLSDPEIISKVNSTKNVFYLV